MWLDKSAACPLCKYNAFTGKLYIASEDDPQGMEEPIPEHLRAGGPNDILPPIDADNENDDEEAGNSNSQVAINAEN